MNQEIYNWVLSLFPSTNEFGGFDRDKYCTASSPLVDIILHYGGMVDGLRNGDSPLLGNGNNKDNLKLKDIRSKATFTECGVNLPHLIAEHKGYYDGSNDPRSPKFVTNAIPVPTKVSLAALVTAALKNQNAVYDPYGQAAVAAEIACAAIMSEQIGWNKEMAGGYFTSGGTAGNKAALRVGLERALPGYRDTGLEGREQAYVLCNELAHFSVAEVAAGTGIGDKHVIRVKSNPDNSMNIEDLEKKMHEIIDNNGRIAMVVSTVGTTDGFGLDSTKGVKGAIDKIERERKLDYTPFLHADLANGGFFSVFNNYDFEKNILEINPKSLEQIRKIRERIKEVEYADSATFDFHKHGYAPYTSTLFIVKDVENLEKICRPGLAAPYIGERDYGIGYHPGYTEECSRGFSSLPAHANLQTLGLRGYQALLANSIERAEQLKDRLKDRLEETGLPIRILNPELPGPIVNFRFYQSKELSDKEANDTATIGEMKATTTFNQKDVMTYFGKHRDEFFLGDTHNYKSYRFGSGENDKIEIASMKAFMMSPFTDEKTIDQLADYIINSYQKITLK